MTDYDKERREAGWCQAYTIAVGEQSLTFGEVPERDGILVTFSDAGFVGRMKLNADQWATLRNNIWLTVRRPDEKPTELGD